MSWAATGSLLESAFGWTLQNSVPAAVLVVLVLLVQGGVGKRLPPRWRYGLWLLVVVRLLIPTTPTASFSVFNVFTGRAGNVMGPRGIVVEVVPSSPRAKGQTPGLRSTADVADVRPAAPALVPRLALSSTRPAWTRGLALLWLTGAAGYVGAVLLQHRRLARRVKSERPVADERFLALMEQGRSTLGLRRPVQVIHTAWLSTPAVFGFARPRLLIPAAMSNGWDERELRYVVLHELVHVGRRDVWLNWILIGTQALHWFNPAVWFALRRLRAEREILCDAIVLSHLDARERRDYGTTLIRLLSSLSQPIQVPSLATIVNRNQQIERRINMISQFKPATRFVTFASAALLLALTCLTFTRAGEKEPAPVPPTSPKTEAEQQERLILLLENELAKRQAEITVKQHELDEMKMKLQITDLDAMAAAAISADSLRELEKERISTVSEHQRLHSLYQQLTNFARPQLRGALPTAFPDALLVRLLEEEAIADQKIAETSVAHGANHPELVSLQRRREKVTAQIDERLDGIIDGLKVRLDGLRAHEKGLWVEIDQAKKRNIEESILRRPYYEAKRDLENLQDATERLKTRLWQQKVDTAILWSKPE